MTIEQQIYEHSLATPDKVALALGAEEITYRRLWEEISRAARWFQTQGDSGERVILSASKSLEFVYCYFGAHLAGKICVPIDPETNETRLRRIVEVTEPRLIIGELRNRGEYTVLPFSECISEKQNTPETPEPHELSDTFESLFPQSFPAEDAIADLLFTTGTTGLPKGVALSYANERAAAANINTFIANDENDVELLALPISHSFGLGRLRCVLSKGATLVLLGSFASMKRFYAAIEQFRVTGFGMVPASWSYIRKMSGERIGRYASQLRYIEIGSAFMSEENKRELMSLLPDTRICMHYGLTEASRSAFISFHDDEPHLMTAGKASPNTELAIFSEQGERLPNDVDGEVCVKGDHVCAAYYGMTDEAFRHDFYDGYFRTGDWGHLDAEGYLHLVSRKKEIINVGGKKVSPQEVEEQLNKIDGIEESACVGIHDDVLGEVVKAYCVCTKDVDLELAKKTLMKHIENYKIPAIIERIAELPKTQNGKLQRLQLKNIS